MINKKMMELGKKRSVIREIFEYSKIRKAQIGEENVFDFSIGNPSIPAPLIVNDTICELVNNTSSVKLHGYTSAQGDIDVRRAISENINLRFNRKSNENLIYMTCGAAASLTITLNALVNDGDEVVVLAPFFPEYRVFVEKSGAKLVVSKCKQEDFQIDFNALENQITNKTKAIIVNSPSNPTGVVFSCETIKKLAELLYKKQKEFGQEIYIISDEPYRELVYDDVKVPFIPSFYDNTIVCYSFSKSLSLPGERIGYIYVSEDINNKNDLYCSVCGAGRALGFVCAPSLLQYTIEKCVDAKTDVTAYKKNRDLFYTSLKEIGFDVVKPQGAFYLFMKTPISDANEFCEMAKKYELLLVPSDSFGYCGYVRICYCVSFDVIKNSLPQFKKLFDEYKGN